MSNQYNVIKELKKKSGIGQFGFYAIYISIVLRLLIFDIFPTYLHTF